MIAGIFFTLTRFLQLLTLIPAMGMLAYFVDIFTKAKRLTPSYVLYVSLPHDPILLSTAPILTPQQSPLHSQHPRRSLVPSDRHPTQIHPALRPLRRLRGHLLHRRADRGRLLPARLWQRQLRFLDLRRQHLRHFRHERGQWQQRVRSQCE